MISCHEISFLFFIGLYDIRISVAPLISLHGHYFFIQTSDTSRLDARAYILRCLPAVDPDGRFYYGLYHSSCKRRNR